jgi:formyl-CoA transferase
MITQAAGEPISMTGEPGRAPVNPGPSFGDTGTGMLMAITLLGALYKRQITGQGTRLQVAMQDAMVHYMRTCFSTQARLGAAARTSAATMRPPASALASPADPTTMSTSPPAAPIPSTGGACSS